MHFLLKETTKTTWKSFHEGLYPESEPERGAKQTFIYVHENVTVL